MTTINVTDYAADVTTQELCRRALNRYNDMTPGANVRREIYAEAVIDAICAIDSPECDGFRATVGTMGNVDLIDTLCNQIVFPVRDNHLDNEFALLLARTFAAVVMTTSRNR